MKNIYKLIIAIALVSLYSCQDAYEIKQVGLLEADNAVTNVDDMELNLLGALGFLDNTAEIQFNGTYTDELGIGDTNGGQNLEELGLVLNSGSGKPATIWSGNYIALNQINRLIASSLSITPAEDEMNRYKDVLGQAYAVRAFLHLTLQTYFSEDLTNDDALGVIALDFAPKVDEFLPRNTNGEVFAVIEQDLNAALENLQDTGVINSDVVKAIFARMYAYRGMYNEAVPYAQELLTSYPTVDQAGFTNMFTDTGAGDVIFKLERTIGDSYEAQGTGGGGFAGSLYSFVTADIDGGLFLEMGRSLFNKISTADVRFNSYVHPTSVIDPDYATSPNYRDSDILAINKYAGSEGQPLMNDLKLIRGAEMLFILAEAGANGGSDLAGAAALIAEIRLARGSEVVTPAVYSSEQEAFADILAERRIELAFEGHRWVDLKRLGGIANVSIDKDPRDCEITGGCTLPVNDFRFTLPIPLRELDLNSQLVQNTNY